MQNGIGVTDCGVNFLYYAHCLNKSTKKGKNSQAAIQAYSYSQYVM